MHLHMACTGTPSAQETPPNKASSTTDAIVGFDLLATNTHSNFVRVAYDYGSKMLQVDHSHGGGQTPRLYRWHQGLSMQTARWR
jgi:hypothetical protein